MNDNMPLGMAIATLLGKLVGVVLKYVVLACTVAWGIRLAAMWGWF